MDEFLDEHTLDFGLDIVDGVRGLYLEGNGFTRQGLDEDLHDGLGDLRISILYNISCQTSYSPRQSCLPQPSSDVWKESVLQSGSIILCFLA